MAIPTTLVVDVVMAILKRSKSLATEKGKFKENSKSISTGVGLGGLGGIMVFSPQIHAAIGPLDSNTQIALHAVVGIVELTVFIYSLYLAGKEPKVKVKIDENDNKD